MSVVTYKDGTQKEVANLGWLLKHHEEVEWFEVHSHYRDNNYWDCVLCAHLKEGGKYTTEFADKSVLWDWLNRPKFRGLPVRWFGVVVAAGGWQYYNPLLFNYDKYKMKRYR